ncbi:MAG: nucleotidyltransferase domain-containing protein [Deltaproteobacteria bacterium]|jgi:predicted nucleotidyltransferase|nr:nucleotidyltransferase domain-containing protein [Deltaproteobacteria bacterium]
MAHDLSKVTTLVKVYADDVRKVLPVNKVFLYGSYAQGNATIYSDVDVCFFLDTYGDINWFGNMKILLHLSHKYKELYIEPIAYEASDLEDDSPFVKEVLRIGIEIF